MSVDSVRRQWALHDDRYIWVEAEIGTLLAHIATLTAEKKNWEEEARRYCRNADYWRERAEQAEARNRALVEALEARSVRCPSCGGLNKHLKDTMNQCCEAFELAWVPIIPAALTEPTPPQGNLAKTLAEMGSSGHIITVKPEPTPPRERTIECTRLCDLTNRSDGSCSIHEPTPPQEGGELG